MGGTMVVVRRVGTPQGLRSSRFVVGVGGRGGRWRSSTGWVGHRSGGGEPRVRLGTVVEERVSGGGGGEKKRGGGVAYTRVEIGTAV